MGQQFAVEESVVLLLILIISVDLVVVHKNCQSSMPPEH